MLVSFDFLIKIHCTPINFTIIISLKLILVPQTQDQTLVLHSNLLSLILFPFTVYVWVHCFSLGLCKTYGFRIRTSNPPLHLLNSFF